MKIENTLIMLKPDCIKRKLLGECISRIEKMENINIKLIVSTNLIEAQVEEFYAHLKECVFFNQIVKFMTSGLVVVIIIEGENIIERVRSLVGATDPAKALKGTIRGDLYDPFSKDKSENLIHSTDKTLYRFEKECKIILGEVYEQK